MEKHLKYLLSIILFIQAPFVFSLSVKDTSAVQKETENYHILDNIDSLLNLWYVKNSMLSQSSNYQINSNSEVVDFPDSVYVERLKRLNTVVDFSYNEIVKSYIDVYAKRRKNQVGLMLGLSDYYFPIFEKILDANDMPLELKYLPIIESALNPRAVSRAGATGIWQFMYTTGKLMNLQVNSYVDERRDPVKATVAAAKYLKQLYNIYGDWMLAIAAYNCGPGNVNKAIKRSNVKVCGKLNYWDIYYNLPRETRGYIPAFIAANYVMNYYKEHGIQPQHIEIFQTDTMMVSDNLHFEQVSSVLGIDLNLLRELNPQYKKDIIPTKGDMYALNIPAEFVNKYIELKDSIFAYKDSIYFNPKKIYYKPNDSKTPDYSLFAKVYYTVKPGDNLKQIAKWYNVDQDDIKQWNKKKNFKVKNGQKLIVYVPKNKLEDYGKINSMTLQAKDLFAMNNSSSGKLTAFKKKENVAKTDVVANKEKEIQDKELQELGKVLGNLDTHQALDSNSTVVAQQDSVQSNKVSVEQIKPVIDVTSSDIEHEYFYYEVKAGDTIWSIAKSFSEVTFDLMQRNNISESDQISPGQKIKVKKAK